MVGAFSSRPGAALSCCFAAFFAVEQTIALVRQRLAVEELKKSTVFAPGLIGVSAETPAEHRELRALLRGPAPDMACLALLREQSPVPRLWGLSGLAVLGDDRWHSHKQALAAEKRMVTMQFGCVIGELPIARVVDETSPGLWLR